jgi:ubiquinone/menaquinone biosynthesis C-methylase UbiE
MDTSDFRRASRAVWDAMAQGWDRRNAYIEESARPVTALMIERLAPAPGQTILELAGGTGLVGFTAASAVRPGGRLIESDFSEAMVDVAKGQATRLGLDNVECRVLDAERLDLADAAVDGVLCRWGYMLMGDPAAAVLETRRVLRHGGRLSCAVFGTAQQNPWVAVPTQVLRERGHMPSSGGGGPGILALGDPTRFRELLEKAGFANVTIEEVPFNWRLDDLDDYWDFLFRAAGAIAMVLRRLDEQEQGRVREEIGQRVAPFAGSTGLVLPAVSLVASAS